MSAAAVKPVSAPKPSATPHPAVPKAASAAHPGVSGAVVNQAIASTTKAAQAQATTRPAASARLPSVPKPPAPPKVPAHETQQQQKVREATYQKAVQAYQKAQEGRQQAEAKRLQREREDRQHGKSTQPAAPIQHAPVQHGTNAATHAGNAATSHDASSTKAAASTKQRPPVARPGAKPGAAAGGHASQHAGGKAAQPAHAAQPVRPTHPAHPAHPAQPAPVQTSGQSTLPRYSLDKPDLSAADAKKYINDSVDRNWNQIRSSLNLSDTAADKNSAKAFFLGAASRESVANGTIRTNLVTGTGSAYSKGPLQTADTAYANNGHPEWDKDTHVPGIKQADLSASNDLSTAIDMGVRHMLEGAELGKLTGHRSTAQLEADSMAHHNTGHIEAAGDPGWQAGYGKQAEIMAAFYQDGHLSDGQVAWTGEFQSEDAARKA